MSHRHPVERALQFIYYKFMQIYIPQVTSTKAAQDFFPQSYTGAEYEAMLSPHTPTFSRFRD
jgi:hypothetical protein